MIIIILCTFVIAVKYLVLSLALPTKLTHKNPGLEFSDDISNIILSHFKWAPGPPGPRVVAGVVCGPRGSLKFILRLASAVCQGTKPISNDANR